MSKTGAQWIAEYQDLEQIAYDAKAHGDRAAQRDVQGRLFVMTQQMPEEALRRLAMRALVEGRVKRIEEPS